VLDRSLVPPLNGRVWRLLVGHALEWCSKGLFTPFVLIYLSHVRGIDLGTVGLILAVANAAGFAAVPFTGILIDRFGAGPTLAAGLFVGAAGTALYTAVTGPAIAFLAGLLYGAASAGTWNAFASLLSSTVSPAGRSGDFSMVYLVQNFGLGLGAALGGVIIASPSPRAFNLVFLIAAGCMVSFAVLLIATGETRLAVRESEATPPTDSRADGAPEMAGTEAAAGRQREPADEGYRAVLADGGLVGVSVLNMLVSLIMVALFAAVFPAWATGPAGTTERVVGLALSANTFTIVLAQLPVLRYLIQGRRRTRTAALGALVFAAACLATQLAGAWPRTGRMELTQAGLIGALALFGLGETLILPCLDSLVNDIAPDRLRGRYNSVYNLSRQVGRTVGPAVAGWALARGNFGAAFVGLISACVVTAVCSLTLERAITETTNRGCARKWEPPDRAHLRDGGSRTPRRPSPIDGRAP